jgi:hypothetical protein
VRAHGEKAVPSRTTHNPGNGDDRGSCQPTGFHPAGSSPAESRRERVARAGPRLVPCRAFQRSGEDAHENTTPTRPHRTPGPGSSTTSTSYYGRFPHNLARGHIACCPIPAARGDRVWCSHGESISAARRGSRCGARWAPRAFSRRPVRLSPFRAREESPSQGVLTEVLSESRPMTRIPFCRAQLARLGLQRSKKASGSLRPPCESQGGFRASGMRKVAIVQRWSVVVPSLNGSTSHAPRLWSRLHKSARARHSRALTVPTGQPGRRASSRLDCIWLAPQSAIPLTQAGGHRPPQFRVKPEVVSVSSKPESPHRLRTPHDAPELAEPPSHCRLCGQLRKSGRRR